MADPQKPDPQKPWCPECQAHTEYKTDTWVSEGTHYTDRTCLYCDNELFIPKMRKDNFKRDSLICICFPTFIFVLMAISGHIDNSTSSWVVIGTILLCSLIIFWATYSDNLRRFRNWKKWAEERGWEEVKA